MRPDRCSNSTTGRRIRRKSCPIARQSLSGAPPSPSWSQPTTLDEPGALRDRFYSRGDAVALGALASPQFTALRLPGARSRRPSSLERRAAAIARGESDEQERRRSAQIARARLPRRRRRGRRGDSVARRRATCCSSIGGFGMQRLHPLKRILGRVTRRQRSPARTSVRPMVFCSPTAPPFSPAAASAARSSTSRPRCSTTSACRSAATWTASRGRISSRAPSPPSARLRSSRPTTAENRGVGGSGLGGHGRSLPCDSRSRLC